MATFEYHTADYVVGLFVMLVPVIIGVLFAIRDKNRATRTEYLLGGRNMKLLPVAMSIFITFQSAISQIGIPMEVYVYGSMIFVVSVGFAISYVVGIYTLVPLFYPLKLTSIYEYLLLRYKSNAVRMMATIIGMITTFLYLAIALLSPALALQHSAGIPLWMSIALVGVIGTIYTAIGGIKSVIWTDAFQTIIVFAGLFAMIAKGVFEVGSVEKVWETARDGHRSDMDHVSFDPRARHQWPSLVIGCLFMWLVNGFNQSTVQRLSAMPTLQKAKNSYLLNIPFTLVYQAVLVLLGNIIYAYLFHKQCDPYTAGIISNRNQLAPYFVLDALNDMPGMAGLYVSTLCCGALSTLSSGINALAANTVEDLLGERMSRYKEGTVTFITKLFVFLHGFAIVGLAYGAQHLSGPVTQMGGTIFGACGSPVLGLFIMGATVPWANKHGALVGALVSLAFNFWVGIGSRMYGKKTKPLDFVGTEGCPVSSLSANVSAMDLFDEELLAPGALPTQITTTTTVASTVMTSLPPDGAAGGEGVRFFLYDISYEWYSVMGVLVCLVVGLTVSRLTRSGKTRTCDPSLIFPFLRSFWGMPENVVFNRSMPDYEMQVKIVADIESEYSHESSRQQSNGKAEEKQDLIG